MLYAVFLFFLFKYGKNYFGLDLDSFFAFLIGAFDSIFLLLLFSNIRTSILYKFANKHSDELEGKVISSRKYTLAILKANVFGLTALFIFIWILYPSWFAAGMACGPFIFFIRILSSPKRKKMTSSVKSERIKS